MQAAGALLAAVLLWDVLFRSQIGVTIAFLEEMWSRNLAHIMVSPLRPIEFTISLGLMSMMRTLIGFVPATLLAIPLYHYSIYDMGLPLVAFFLCLVVFGWGMGFAIAALLMRWGLAAESLAWLAIFALAPLSGVYYPIDTLPSWVQPVSWALPSAHIFEGMRAFLFEGVFRIDYLLRAIALDLVYLCLGASAFLYSIRLARIHGLFLRVGE